MNMRISRFVVAAAVLVLPELSWADGPHWQIPNPWTEYEMDSGRPRPPKVAQYAEHAKAKSKVILTNGPFTNPGAVSFAEMDEKSIKYYEEHCAFKYPGNKSEFYIMIMLKAAQAMREVDTYCPCPDSYPLWHSEEGREFMLWAAAQTWKASTTLPPKEAQACVNVIIQSFVESVRFKEDPEITAKFKGLIEAYKAIAVIMAKTQGVEDPEKLKQIFVEWQQAAQAVKGEGTFRQAMETFRFLTGDIPAVHMDTKTRMAQAIINMGPGVLPALAEALKQNKNPAVQTAIRMVGEAITQNAARPRPSAPKPPEPKKPAPQPQKADAQKPKEQKLQAGEPENKSTVQDE